jgi:hypothetical protein
MSSPETLIYIKKSLKSWFRRPGLKSISSYFKYYGTWRDHLISGRNSVDDQTPWMCFPAIEFLKNIASPGMRVFEYGSGGSTMFWQSRVQEIVSVEHDLPWYNQIKERLLRDAINNVTYILCEPVQDPDFSKKKFEDPRGFISGDPAYTGKIFENYARTIDSYPDHHFDIVIVDGRARPSCIQQALPKLKVGGWLVIDNTERKYYMAPFPFEPKSWKISTFAGPVPYMREFSETSILKKLC